jgi:hypothetical protein
MNGCVGKDFEENGRSLIRALSWHLPEEEHEKPVRIANV